MNQITIPDSPSRRRSFWLRCWQTHDEKASHPPGWRFSLEDPQSGEKFGFTDMQSVTEFLVRELGIVDQEKNNP